MLIGRMRITVGAEVALELALPPDAAALPPPPFDPGALPGAELSAARAWQHAGARIDIACARGGAWLWLDGLEGPLFDGASALVQKHLALPSLAPGAIARDGLGWSQAFGAEHTRGRHLLAFRGDQAHLCSVVCRGDCDGAPPAAWHGITAPPATPAPIAAAMEHPHASLGTLALVAAAAIAAILHRRPRRPR